ncbi:hypothetical protein C7974DRAFT_449069 [Boeremia exigua]|uniref:uncharacterized protein n=1 Tax=Boeremia exigua TaxID=749465 RepID=UPI001E8E6973|nr:uncharacterized protein C7974DRAFT_449069 [Boeremia exigua]KAH6639140.1 hypothetical protein C7974DRAFT_449069 [Boeremia exigua]
MASPASPRLLPAAEISGDIGPQEDQKYIFPSELPETAFSPTCEEDMAMVTSNRAIAPSDDNHTQQAPMAIGPQAMQWTSDYYNPHEILQHASAFSAPAYFTADPSCASYPMPPHYDPPYNANHALNYPHEYMNSRPRGYNMDFSGYPRHMATSYPPSTFVHCPPDMPSADSSTQLTQLSDDYDLQYADYFKQEDQLDYASPYSGTSRASTPYSTGREEDEPIDKEQPYAQLIYRALLTAPQHTMVLRDIYDWFKTYTDKATHSETKGWQNSIRHNLSMNGAFEKVDSPAEATTKGFMWRLTPASLREGVKSTTRYRSKAPHKRTTHRTPLPQRQASGAKGGQASRRSTTLRRARPRAPPSPSPAPRSTPFSFPWPEPSRSDSPYDPLAFTPYHHDPKDAAFEPMLGLAAHLVSPPRSYAGSPGAPSFVSGDAAFGEAAYAGDQAFGGEPAYALERARGAERFFDSPSPALEPVTPVVARGWEDVPLGVDVFDELAGFGGGPV